jgi:2-polyprenyl-3-methyl-5-hydroxy-6-metoxy-1,4-benzoquinol methylase
MPDDPGVHATNRALAADAYDELWLGLEDFLQYNPGARHRRRLVLRALRNHAGDARSILDVGCGVGEMIAFLAERFPGARFTGVDLSPVAIESCKRRLPVHEWRVSDITVSDLPGGFDAAICSELLEHLDTPDAAMRRVVRAVKPGGTVVVTVPNGRVFPTERAVGHVAHPRPAEIDRWFEVCDLELVERSSWGWPGYLALKYAANVNAERALKAFASGRYSWTKRRLNDLAYAAAGVASLRDHERGPQSIVVGRRRCATAAD